MKIKGILLGVAALATCALASTRAQAQQQIFLEIPGVQGEATSPAFVNQIDVLSASFAASNPACTKSSISVSELILTKRADKATVDLLAAMRDRTTYATVTIRFARSNDGQVYQKYDLSNAMFSAASAAGGVGDLRNMESWNVSFSQAIVTYTFIDGQGKPSGTESVTLVPLVCPGS